MRYKPVGLYLNQQFALKRSKLFLTQKKNRLREFFFAFLRANASERRSKLRYKTSGVCSRSVEFDVIDNKVKNVRFEGGCSGNTQGVAALVDGMDIDEAIRRMSGIKCGFKPTSCPDQLADALKQYKEQA